MQAIYAIAAQLITNVYRLILRSIRQKSNSMYVLKLRGAREIGDPVGETWPALLRDWGLN